MDTVQLAEESVEAVAQRVVELLATKRPREQEAAEGVPLLPIAAPRVRPRKRPGRRRDDLAGPRKVATIGRRG